MSDKPGATARHDRRKHDHMFTGMTQMHDLAATQMRDRQRVAREHATRHAARRGRHLPLLRKQSGSR